MRPKDWPVFRIFHEETVVAHMVNEVHGKPKFIVISNSEDIDR